MIHEACQEFPVLPIMLYGLQISIHKKTLIEKHFAQTFSVQGKALQALKEIYSINQPSLALHLDALCLELIFTILETNLTKFTSAVLICVNKQQPSYLIHHLICI